MPSRRPRLRSAWELSLSALGALTLLGTVWVHDAIRRADPALAVSVCYREHAAMILSGYSTPPTWSRSGLGRQIGYTTSRPGFPLDPWGRPWLFRKHQDYKMSPGELSAFSAGPNGRNERGGGDDVFPEDHGAATAVAANARPLLGLCAFTLAWLALLPRLLASPRAGPGVEALRVAALSSLPSTLIVLGAAGIDLDPTPLLTHWVLVSPRVALASSLALACTLGALGWRLSRPGSPEPPYSPAARRAASSLPRIEPAQRAVGSSSSARS